jgi:superfamily I DNA and/or RNA helicase
MNRLIMGYSAATFYDNQLKAHASVENHTLGNDEHPLQFIDTAGCGFEEKTSGTAISNPEEAAFVIGYLKQLSAEKQWGNDFPTVGIISPYRKQIDELKEALLQTPELLPYQQQITINTIDSFQGQERDMILISMTRSNNDNRIGFLSEIRRMNVAMTRARKKLVVIGDSSTLSQHDYYAGFISYAEQHEAYKSAWEFMGV